MVPMLLMFGAFYFIMIRPQRKQQKEREDKLAGLKKNDHVLTHSGIYGIVDKVTEKEVFLKVDESKGVKIHMVRSAIADIIKPSSGGAGEDGVAEGATGETGKK